MDKGTGTGTGTEVAEDFKRWFYGGAPPEGDDVAESLAQMDVACDCRQAACDVDARIVARRIAAVV